MCELLPIGVSLSVSNPLAMCKLMLIWGETFHSFANTSVQIVFFKLIIPPIKWHVLFEVKNLDPRDVYKRDHSIVDTHISLLSNSNKCIKPRSMFQCLRSSLRCVFLVTNQFDPAKKASSVMAASVSSTALAIWAYHSPNTETQLKPVHLSTGVVWHATSLRLKVPP